MKFKQARTLVLPAYQNLVASAAAPFPRWKVTYTLPKSPYIAFAVIVFHDSHFNMILHVYSSTYSEPLQLIAKAFIAFQKGYAAACDSSALTETFVVERTELKNCEFLHSRFLSEQKVECEGHEQSSGLLARPLSEAAA
jgi:hypothetical protein